MATVTRTLLLDDLNGSTEDVSTVQFHLGKTSYEIDLTATNDARLRGKLARFLDAAPIRPQRPATRRSVKAVPVGRDQPQAIRNWAKSASYEISTRGRIPKNIPRSVQPGPPRADIAGVGALMNGHGAGPQGDLLRRRPIPGSVTR